MSSLPSAIIFINNDITYNAHPPPYPPSLDVFIGSIPNNPRSYITSPSELTKIQTQLYIDDTMTKREFDQRMELQPDYATIVHLRGLRILVILPTFHDYKYKEYADLVLFLHQGLVDVEFNRFEHREDKDDGYNACDPCNPCDGYPSKEYSRSMFPALNYSDNCWNNNFEEQDGYCFNNRSAFGPPKQSYDLQRINIYELLRASRFSCGEGEFEVPFEEGGDCCEMCKFPYRCDKCHTFSGIKICDSCCGECKCGCGFGLINNQGLRYSPIHLPNKDKETNNWAFKHRK